MLFDSENSIFILFEHNNKHSPSSQTQIQKSFQSQQIMAPTTLEGAVISAPTREDFLHNPVVRKALPFVNGGIAGMIATTVIQPIVSFCQTSIRKLFVLNTLTLLGHG